MSSYVVVEGGEFGLHSVHGTFDDLKSAVLFAIYKYTYNGTEDISTDDLKELVSEVTGDLIGNRSRSFSVLNADFSKTIRVPKNPRIEKIVNKVLSGEPDKPVKTPKKKIKK